MKGHIRSRGPGAWELKFDLGRDPVTGKRRTRYKTVHGGKRAAQTELNRVLNGVEEKTFIDNQKMTAGEFFDDWLKVIRAGVSPTTFERWESICKIHLKPALGNIKLRDLEACHIESYYATARENGKVGGGALSEQTLKHHHRLLSQILKRAVHRRLIVRNPVSEVDTPRPEAREIESLSKEEIPALLVAFRDTRLYTPVLVAVTTGLRRGELLGLRWQDVDLDTAILTVNQSLEQTKAGLRFKPPKTKKSRRSITLPAVTVSAFRKHRVQQSKERLKLGLGRNNGLVFTKTNGEPINPRNFSKEFIRIIARAKLPRITFHGLRHTHLSHLLRDGIHVKVVSERAGHSTVATTLNIYAHVIPSLQTDAAAKVDESLRAALEE